MNINDVPTEELWSTVTELYPTTDPIKIMFIRQKELMGKYLALESQILKEPLVVIPVDLHSARGQRILKSRAWWVVEEIVEGIDALVEEEDSAKFLEEMSDALHFLTELWILTGLPYPVFHDWDSFSTLRPSTVPYLFQGLVVTSLLGVIIRLGRAMWQLRNKPWKKTQVLTDVPRFTLHLMGAYKLFLELLHRHYKLGFKDICILYLRKSEVNKFRQRSNY